MTNTYIALSTITLATAASSVTFGSIPQTYRDLVVVFKGGSVTSIKNLWQFINGDTSVAAYGFVHMSGDGSSTFSTAVSGINQAPTLTQYGWLENNLNATITCNILDYSATDKHKTYLSRASNSGNGVTALAGRWANTSAITSLTYQTNLPASDLLAGTTISLYGIAG